MHPPGAARGAGGGAPQAHAVIPSGASVAESVCDDAANYDGSFLVNMQERERYPFGGHSAYSVMPAWGLGGLCVHPLANPPSVTASPDSFPADCAPCDAPIALVAAAGDDGDACVIRGTAQQPPSLMPPPAPPMTPAAMQQRPEATPQITQIWSLPSSAAAARAWHGEPMVGLVGFGALPSKPHPPPVTQQQQAHMGLMVKEVQSTAGATLKHATECSKRGGH